MPPTHRTIVTCAIIFCVLILPGAPAVLANGWEHGAIPFEALVKALTAGDSPTRKQAAHSMGARGQREAVPHLIERLTDGESDPAVRGEIYGAFGRLGDGRALSPLKDCLAEETRVELRATCAAALGGLGSEAALKVLLGQMATGKERLVRQRSVDALGHFLEPSALEALTEIAGGADRDLAVRAVAALGRSGRPEAAAPVLDYLSMAQTDEERLTAVSALMRIGAPESIEPLSRLLQETKSDALRMSVTIALGAARDGQALPTLVRLLDDPAPGVAYRALAALSEIGATEAAPAVARKAGGLAARLAKAAPEELLAAPGVWLDDLALLEKALRTLTEVEAAAGIEAMLVAAARKDVGSGSAAALALSEALYQVRRRALYGLGYTKSPAAAELLRGSAGVKDSDFRLRAVALRSLGVLGGHANAHAVAHYLTDASAEVRWTAAEVLGRLGHKDDGPALAEALEDPVGEVRRQAALALGYLGVADARPALIGRAEGDADPRVRAAAAYAVSLLP